ncbi:F-box/WD repeat-containing protein 5-like [Pollicipes pollicipes]|uniref:F-box/WD repeat-containing protein 5-like n=1 Tax=Pollicipes pollicipes TaxID=41117 RepID=UPI0018854B12|nr:F-box/WD repeat-containing protein 5-like [Pollicipes pollicipes]
MEGRDAHLPAHDEPCSRWAYMPQELLAQIFSHLEVDCIGQAAQVCRVWASAALDTFLWKHKFIQDFDLDPSTCHLPKATKSSGQPSWRGEYRRIVETTPCYMTDELTDHGHQVLHVSFSHNGQYFATCSKDGYVLLWDSGHPVRIRHYRDMRVFSWKYTQFSEFNATDTLLLVSGVHFGQHSVTGEIAVFTVDDEFELQCRINNKPYDIFGTWFNQEYVISGELIWLNTMLSESKLWLNKAHQETTSEHIAIVQPMFRFFNGNVSFCRMLRIAEFSVLPSLLRDSVAAAADCGATPPMDGPAGQREECRTTPAGADRGLTPARQEVKERVKYLLFTTGSKTYTPHQIGFKRLDGFRIRTRLEPGPSLRERVELRRRAEQLHQELLAAGQPLPDQPDWNDWEAVKHQFDTVDHVIDLHGHIIGMCLSPNQRYLYVNTRPWPDNYVIENPLHPPPIAREIDMHVIDVATKKRIGKTYRAHKAYTCNEGCFFLFVDVAKQFVASGAEDKRAYLWDRHHTACLSKYPHDDVVNAVAFSPADPGVLVTVSDDCTVKVWRSRLNCQRLGIDTAELPRCERHRRRRRGRSCGGCAQERARVEPVDGIRLMDDTADAEVRHSTTGVSQHVMDLISQPRSVRC